MGLVRSDFKSSKHTLDILAKYLNYYSFEDFQYVQETEGLVKKDKSDIVGNFFNNIFSGGKVYHDSNYHFDLLRNIFMWMQTQPQYNVEIYTGVSSSPYGRRVFFQDHVNVDAFNKGFGKGLHYYLLHANDAEEKLLGYSLNCLRYYLNGDLLKFANCFKHIQDYKHEDIITYHPVVIDRFYAAVILNHSISTEPGESSKETPNMPELDMLTSSSLSMTNACYHIGESLLLTGDFQKAYEIFSSSNVKDLRVPEQLKPDYTVQLKIFKMVSGFLSGHTSMEKANTRISELEATQLPFLQRDYLSLFIESLKYKINPKLKARKTILNSINILIEKTGFKNFHSIFKRIENTAVMIKV